MKEISLFDSTQWSWGTEFSFSPGIYLGMHDKQLYVQENAEVQKLLEASPRYIQHSKYPWQPYPAIGMKAWYLGICIYYYYSLSKCIILGRTYYR